MQKIADQSTNELLTTTEFDGKLHAKLETKR
jgi:hypothetical protein